MGKHSTSNLVTSENVDLICVRSTKNSGLTYSPFKQVHNEFIVNSSLPSLESIGVRKIQHLVQVKVRSVSRHVAIAIHVTDVAAVVAVDAVVSLPLG